jgi:hypothetical protein
MGSDVKIQKTVYNVEDFKKVVDTNFKTFTQPLIEDDPDTVENFFRLYEKLYFVIPPEGEVDSHEYLIKKSSELVDFEKTTEEIQPLLDEISQLREQLLQANQQILDLETKDR